MILNPSTTGRKSKLDEERLGYAKTWLKADSLDLCLTNETAAGSCISAEIITFKFSATKPFYRRMHQIHLV